MDQTSADQGPRPGPAATRDQPNPARAASPGTAAPRTGTPAPTGELASTWAGPPGEPTPTRELAPTGSAPTGEPAPTSSGPRGQPRPPQPRPAQPGDVPEILRLIRELAAYERAAEQVVATDARITALLFGDAAEPGVVPAPAAFCHVIDAPTQAARSEASPRLAGFALWFRNASTWLGQHGVYLEDLYVSPEHRGHGYGRALMAALAALCVERGYGRLEWWVLDWNTPAIDFYRSLGAQAMDEWTVHRLTGPALAALAASAATATDAPTRPAEATAPQGPTAT